MNSREFKTIIQLLQLLDDPIYKCVAPAFHIFQYNVIARLDDTAHLLIENLRVNNEFPSSLMVKLGWSKNVHEERDAPFQILLGAMNPSYCVLLSFAIFLEYWFATHLGLTPNCPFVFGLDKEDIQR